jgi:hypothetical protein
LIEIAVLKRFESKRKLANHKWIFDVEMDYINKNIKTILDVLNIEYIEEKMKMNITIKLFYIFIKKINFK